MNVYIPPIIEKVYNVQGSTAAPGSGEYHRYRAMRRRERTIAAAMEKEYKERKDQKEFEEKKEFKNQRIESDRQKKKNRRMNREEKIKKKKKMLKNLEEKKNLFSKDIPLIEQIKNEMGEDQFKKLCYQEEKNIDEYNYNAYENNYLDTENKEEKVKPAVKKIRRSDFKDNDLLNANGDFGNTTKEEDQHLLKLFPQVHQKDYEFDNYDEYQEHLEILEIIEKNERILNKQEGDNEQTDNQNKEVKYVEETDNITIHDEF